MKIIIAYTLIKSTLEKPAGVGYNYHMKIRRRLLRNILVWGIFFSIVLTWYINTFLAPSKLKDLFIKNISQAVNRPVSVESIRFNLIHGFIINDLTVYEPDQKTTFLKVKRITTSLLFIPIITEKQIILPVIYMTSPIINIAKNQDNTWNFSAPALLKKEIFEKKDGKSNFSVFVQKIRFDDGKVNFLDRTHQPVYTKELTAVSGDVSLSVKGIVQFKAIAQLDTQQKTAIAIDGAYLLKEKLAAFKATIKALSLLEPVNYFYKTGSFADIKNGLADLYLDLRMDRNNKIILDINALVKNLDIASYGVTLKGNAGAAGRITLNLSEGVKADYNVDLDMKGPTLSGVYLFNEISNLTGKIKISNEGITTQMLQGIAYNTPLNLHGGITIIPDPQLNISIEADLNLLNYKNFLPEDLKTNFKNTDLEGSAQIDINVYDNLKDPQPSSVEGNIKLKNAFLKNDVFPKKFENITGTILFKKDVFYFSRFLFNYAAQDYTLDAKVTGIDKPDILMKLKNNTLLLNSRFQMIGDNVHILRADGNYLNSSFNMAGDINDLKNPAISLRGNAMLDLVDLRKLLPAAAESLTRFDIKGKSNLEFYAKGPWKEPEALELIINGKSDRITLWNLKFDNAVLNLKMKDKILVIPEFSSRPYSGAFLSRMDIDFTQPNPPYSINLSLEGLDLGKFILDTDLKNKQMSGTALGKANIRGYGKNPETIKGEGFVLVKGAYLWEIPLLRGLADLLFLPNLSSLVFEEASADFVITNKNISTANLALHSQNVSLLGEGALTFDGLIDLSITTSISEEYLKSTSEFGRLAGILVTEAGQLMGTIKVEGPIKKPEYKFIPLPIDKVLKDKLKVILGGFF